MVLASHRVAARVHGGTVTPRLVRFHLTPALGVKLDKISRLREELALALDAPRCRVVRHGGQIDVELPREAGRRVRLDEVLRGVQDIPPWTVVLGLDEEGAPLLVRLASAEVAHALIAGTTGSGKTALARTMIASLALTNRLADLSLVLIDPKGRGYGVFAGLPHLMGPVVTEVDEAVAVLDGLVGEMERRDRLAPAQVPRLVVFIDELADLLMTGGAAAARAVTRLAQRGRGAGIHLVACTQKPSASVTGTLLKATFPLRLVGSVPSADDAKVAAGVPGTGAESLMGRGDFLLVAKGQQIRFQAAFIAEQDIAHIVRCLGAGLAMPPRQLPEPQAASETEALQPPLLIEHDEDNVVSFEAKRKRVRR